MGKWIRLPWHIQKKMKNEINEIIKNTLDFLGSYFYSTKGGGCKGAWDETYTLYILKSTEILRYSLNDCSCWEYNLNLIQNNKIKGISKGGSWSNIEPFTLTYELYEFERKDYPKLPPVKMIDGILYIGHERPLKKEKKETNIINL